MRSMAMSIVRIISWVVKDELCVGNIVHNTLYNNTSKAPCGRTDIEVFFRVPFQ